MIFNSFNYENNWKNIFENQWITGGTEVKNIYIWSQQPNHKFGIVINEILHWLEYNVITTNKYVF